MSNKLPTNQVKTVSLRTNKEIVEKADKAIEESTQYDSRSDFLRTQLQNVAETETNQSWEPPEDETLETAYRALLTISNKDGIVRERYAKRRLAAETNTHKKDVRPEILTKLENMAYIVMLSGFPSKAQDHAIGVRPTYDR
jgi:Arc/MetJ-type ribon-helix-helix transcriptional regulator